MKIYIAARFKKKKLVQNIQKKLEKVGYSISYDWTKHKPIKPYNKHQKTAAKYSENELIGISDCDVFIYISDEGGTTLPMEFGAALILAKNTGKPLIYVVGKYNDKSPWFFNPRVIRKGSIDEVIDELENNDRR